MKFNPLQTDLPIGEVIQELLTKLETENTVILNAPPGAGKSTIIPLALLEEAQQNKYKILVLEPRRLAAKSIAMRMADLLGEPVGKSVGYRIRFETRVSEETVIEVITEGILTRILQNDNTIEGIGVVIFDEFHERSIHTDLALAFCRETQQILRDDLKICIMSATLNTEKLQLLLNAPTIISNGKMFPVDVFYGESIDLFSIAEAIAEKAINVLDTEEGDLLLFLPGQGEINRCAEIIQARTKDILVFPLYGMLPSKKQFEAIHPHPSGKRKIVIATPIAETSLTIEGIKVVIDSGYYRSSQFDSKIGLSRLVTKRISVDAADQRAGRAGRLSAGKCYRMWSKGEHSQLLKHRKPEIEEADLCSLVLELAHWGIKDFNNLEWLSPPPNGNVYLASTTLEQLGAIESNKITKHGKALYHLPCHPRIAHMLLFAQEQNTLPLAADLAALLEERDPLSKDKGVDITIRIEALRRFRSQNNIENKLKQIAKIASSYLQLFGIKSNNNTFDPYECGLLLAQCFPERIAFARPGNNAQFQLANGTYAMMSHKDDLALETYISIAHVDARDKIGKIFMAAPLNPKDLAPFVKEISSIKWNHKDGGLTATKEVRIGTILLSSSPIRNISPEEKQNALIDALKKHGENLLHFDEETIQLQNRISHLTRINSSKHWPNFSTNYLLETVDQWLSPYLSQVKTNEQLYKLSLHEILFHSLSYEQQNELSLKAPKHIEVPSGSKIKIQYPENASSPILAVRIQEIFGLEKTPTYNEGKNKVLLHLLSPGFKPVQITDDLQSFWNNTYFEIKKELKQRYSKHFWPENPMDQKATSKTKKQWDKNN